jgi:thymidylate synthase (FAD)
MQTKLIAITQPFVPMVPEGFRNPHPGNGHFNMTPEQFIVYIARVSNPANQMNTETGHKLIRYLIKHKHWSPFEHVSCTFEIWTSRAIAAQILRHRSFTFQEFSQRYATATRLEAPEWRMQGKTNRQVGDDPVVLSPELQEIVKVAQETSLAAYNALIEKGIAKECARIILPLNTQTRIYMSGTLRSWIHYLDLRCAEGTQKEHREIALDIKKGLEGLFPETFKAINELNVNEG